jgi:hypothetical protein
MNQRIARCISSVSALLLSLLAASALVAQHEREPERLPYAAPAPEGQPPDERSTPAAPAAPAERDERVHDFRRFPHLLRLSPERGVMGERLRRRAFEHEQHPTEEPEARCRTGRKCHRERSLRRQR